MCNNVIKNAIARLPWYRKAEFNVLLTQARIKKRQILWIAQDGQCHYCGRDTVLPRSGAKNHGKAIATLDHIATQSDGGTDHLHNMVVACSACNTDRGNMPYEKFYNLVKTPGAWEIHMKEVRAEKAARDEAKRQEILRQHNDLVATERAAAKIRREQKSRNHAPNIIKNALKNGIELPESEEERIQWAIDYHTRQVTLAKSFGPDGFKLVKDFLHRANFEPRKDGMGTILVLDIRPGEHYRGDVPTEDYPSMAMAA